MGLTPAQQSQMRKRAAMEAKAAAPEQTMAGATSYELMLAQLAQHRARLKQIQSQQGKAEVKRMLLPEYVPYVDGVLSAGRGAQDDVLTTVMIWRIDVGDYAGALDIATYVIEHKLLMPDRFARTTGCMIAEEIADMALNAQKAGNSFELDVLVRAGTLTANEDMPDQVQAKILLATGRAHAGLVNDDAPGEFDLVNLETARRCISKAIELHSNCGGKKDLERIERLIKKHPPAEPGPVSIEKDDLPADTAVAQEGQSTPAETPEQAPADPEPVSSGSGDASADTATTQDESSTSADEA